MSNITATEPGKTDAVTKT